MNNKGLFVVIEGMDGTGKSFLTNLIYKKLLNINEKVIKTREPGGIKVNEMIRNIIFSKEGNKLPPESETLLFLASRACNIKQVIEPAIKKGFIVLCDRFNTSTIVYQGKIRQPDKVEYVREICNYVVGNITPNLIIYMQGKAIDAFNRRKKKTENVNRYDTKNLDFYKKVEKSYNEEIEEERKKTFVLYLDSKLLLDDLAKKAVKTIIDLRKEK